MRGSQKWIVWGITASVWMWLFSGAVPNAAFAIQDATYAEIEGNQIQIPLGQTSLVPFYQVKRVALGNGKLAEVRVLEDTSEILIIGNQEGTTDLRVWDRQNRHRKYLVKIVNQANISSVDQIRGLLANYRELRVREEGEFAVVEGETSDETIFGFIEQLQKRFPKLINQVSRPAVAIQEMVMLDVKVVEVRRNALKKMGIRWGGSMPGPVFEMQGRHSRFGLLSSLGSDIELMETNGSIRVLAEPTLMALSGSRAEFVAGGEVPIPVKTDDGISVTFKNYGILLNIEPMADAKGWITTRVEVEVSSVDHAVQVMGIPGFLTRKTDTMMNVHSGETMVLSGLVNSADSKDVSKVPFIGSIPILGELFKSREFVNQQTELVIFVTPHLVDASSSHNRTLHEKGEALREETNDNFKIDILD
jgi:pilus assembly protein CpaC